MPLAYIFQDKRRWLSPDDIIKLTLDYFNLAKKDTELHNFLCHMLQLYVFSLLETYYSDANLTFLLTVVRFVAERDARWDHKLAYAVEGMAGTVSEDIKAVDKQGLMLVKCLECYAYRVMKLGFSYLELLWGVVGDKNIPEKYALNGQRYALSAVACLQYLCCHPTCQCAVPRNCISSTEGDDWPHRYKQELTTNLLPFLLEHAEPSENLERFISQNVSAKKLLQGLITETKLDSAVIAQYLTL
ncbi:hypothetical protein GALMADRAFT_215089 [Galerina marginata CBS 339.88]|uniref:Uncharacterized protein n=1 Tax=Galerina marginata (strain CBS 339.88) TaxID=685588 RepID=A0A067SEN7_GALM3|nr:hypothetical protein GALMADRAFT_215089 [Galerina marginata CBS 339.88]